MHFETRKRAVNVPNTEDTSIVVIVPYTRVTVKVLRSQFHAIILYRVLYRDDQKTINPLLIITAFVRRSEKIWSNSIESIAIFK